MTATQTQYQALVKQATEAKIAYDQGDLTMADAEYDQLVAEIAAAESEHPDWVSGTSITEVIETTGDLPDIEHAVPMLSLDKVHEDVPALLRWLDGTGTRAVEVQPKYDGMAVSALYDGGKLIHLATRGTGTVGEDITFAARQVRGLPLQTDATARFEVRGEIVMSAEDFEEANRLRTEEAERRAAERNEELRKKGLPETAVARPKLFVNKRNGTVGAVRGSKGRAYDIPVRLFAYDGVLADGTGVEDRELERAGFIPATGIAFEEASEQDIRVALDSIERERARGDVDLDGAVVKVTDRSLRAKLGATGHHPRWAMAYKFAPEERSTTLLDVIWQVGRTGVIAPRAVLDPVFVGGSTITYVTLHNPNEIDRMDVRIGDTVMVRRAGDVIPRIEGVLTSQRDGTEAPIAKPTDCPQCGGDIDTSEARWRCEDGAVCGMGRLIEYATGREAWDIEGVGGTIASELTGVIVKVSDLLSLPVERIADLPRRGANGQPVITKDGTPSVVGMTVASKIADQAEAARALPLHRHLTALGMLSTGRRISKNLASHFGTLAALRAATVEDLAEVEKIGTVKAATIRGELDRLSDDLDQLEALGVNLVEPKRAVADGGPLVGKTVVATGSFERWDRKSVGEAIESAGGKVGSSVSKNTDLLIAGEKAGSKRAKAESLGVEIVDEAEFAAMIG